MTRPSKASEIGGSGPGCAMIVSVVPGNVMPMRTLMDSITGTYRVATLSSVYIIDLGAEVVSRAPNIDGVVTARLRQDESWTKLVRIVDCTVGARMELFIDLGVAGVTFTSRRSTTVVEIAPIIDFDEARSTPQM